jgi:hypothetical protein
MPIVETLSRDSKNAVAQKCYGVLAARTKVMSGILPQHVIYINGEDKIN